MRYLEFGVWCKTHNHALALFEELRLLREDEDGNPVPKRNIKISEFKNGGMTFSMDTGPDEEGEDGRRIYPPIEGVHYNIRVSGPPMQRLLKDSEGRDIPQDEEQPDIDGNKVKRKIIDRTSIATDAVGGTITAKGETDKLPRRIIWKNKSGVEVAALFDLTEIKQRRNGWVS